MPKKKKTATFSAVTAVKANARDRLGTPPPSTPIPDRLTKAQHKPPKHKPKLEDLIAASSKDHPA